MFNQKQIVVGAVALTVIAAGAIGALYRSTKKANADHAEYQAFKDSIKARYESTALLVEDEDHTTQNLAGITLASKISDELIKLFRDSKYLDDLLQYNCLLLALHFSKPAEEVKENV